MVVLCHEQNVFLCNVFFVEFWQEIGPETKIVIKLQNV